MNFITSDAHAKVTGLWLSTGKKIQTGLGIALTDTGALVRTENTIVLVIPSAHIVAIEVTYEDFKKLDEWMNGQGSSKA